MSPREKHEWLLSLKPGDEVAIVQWGCYPSIERVSRVSPGRVVVGGNLRKFSTSDGSVVGIEEYRSYMYSCIVPVTEKLREQYELGQLWRWIKQLRQSIPRPKVGQQRPENQVIDSDIPPAVVRQILVALEQIPKAKEQ